MDLDKILLVLAFLGSIWFGLWQSSVPAGVVYMLTVVIIAVLIEYAKEV